MKRFTLLTMLIALLSVTAFAQKDLNPRQWQGTIQNPNLSTAIKGVARQAQSATNRAKSPWRSPAELVTPPDNATVETWNITDGGFYSWGGENWLDYTSYMPTINVAVDGSNIYLQGLAYWFKNGWIKGTINGNTAFFDNGQLVGEDDYGPEYIVGSNDGSSLSDGIIFNYDAENGVLASATTFIVESSDAENVYAYCYWYMPTFTKATGQNPEPVVAPDGLETDEWAISAMDNFGDPVSGYVNIGFDGNEVYLQGLCHYLPETWIKGSLEGNIITFPGDQYFGPYDADYYTHYEFYLRSEDVVFTYDAEAGKMTAEGEVYIREAIRNYKGDVYNNPVLTKVVEMAATPATPSISEIYDATTAPVVMFTVPTTDVEGNAMSSSKLSFQFLKDVEGDISPVTFDPADYQTLTEAITVFPYGFTDEVYLFYNYMYLLQEDFSTWNRIGLQSIYTGGGEENMSEIYWFEIKPYEKTVFNFNAMTDEPCSNNGHEGDITEARTFTEGNVTMTVSTSTTNTANRFWNTNNGPQLRIYGGTMTFEVPIGKVISKMVFNNGKWNENNSADTGSFEGNVWTGYAQKVVVTIAGNTQLNSIEVFPTDYVPTAVVAPENMATDTYIFQANSEKPYYDPAELTLWVKVGFDGNDAYIQGLASDTNSNAGELWVKATKNEAGQYVIPANQFMGDVSFWMSSMSYFFTAVDEEGNMVDAVLDFDAENSQFSSAQALVINASLTELVPQQTFTNVTITKFNEVAATPADPIINYIDFGEWSHGLNCIIPSFGSNGETLNPQKLFYTVWVEQNGEQTPYVFSSNMYWGFDEDATEVPYNTNFSTWDNTHSIYFYDDAAVCDSWEKVGIQSIYYGAGECNKSNTAWIENPSYIPDAVEATISAAGYATIYFPKADLEIPEGVKAFTGIVNGELLSLTEVTGTIPAATAVVLKGEPGTYSFATTTGAEAISENDLIGADIDIDATGRYVLAQPEGQKVGFYLATSGTIQAGKAFLDIESDIKVFLFEGDDATGIESLTPALSKGEGAIYNIAGQRINKIQKGINIVNGKKVLR